MDGILEERASTYGDFAAQSVVSQEVQTALIKGYMMRGDGMGLDDIPPYMLEVLSMIATKLSRVVNGDPFYKDNWVDIAGYANLVVKELEKVEAQDAAQEFQESEQSVSIQHTGSGTTVPDSTGA